MPATVVMMPLMVVMFPLSKRNMNSNIDLTMICNKNHHIKMYDQKVKIVLFTVKIVKNFCTRLA